MSEGQFYGWLAMLVLIELGGGVFVARVSLGMGLVFILFGIALAVLWWLLWKGVIA